MLPRPAWSTGARWPLSGWSLDGQPQGRVWVGMSRYLAWWSTRAALRGGKAAGRGEELRSASTGTRGGCFRQAIPAALPRPEAPRIRFSFRLTPLAASGSLVYEAAAATRQPESHCLEIELIPNCSWLFYFYGYVPGGAKLLQAHARYDRTCFCNKLHFIK